MALIQSILVRSSLALLRGVEETFLSNLRSISLPPENTRMQHVIHLAQLYHRGVICPTETWNVIYEGTKHLDIVALFRELADDKIDLVRAIYRERPSSLENLAKSYPDSQFPAILAWCVAGIDC